jgi:hypothetical protein
LRGALSTRLGAVAAVSIVVWGLTLFDLTLLPRAPGGFLAAYDAQKVLGVRIDDQTKLVTTSNPMTPNGLWVVNSERGSLQVSGTDIPKPKGEMLKPVRVVTRASVPHTGNAEDYVIGDWKSGPAIFEISSPDARPRVTGYSLDHPGRPLLSARPPIAPLTMDRRNFYLARWSGPLPDLYVIDRNAGRRLPKRQPSYTPWTISIYSGESGFTRLVKKIPVRSKLSRRLSKFDWWVGIGSRNGRKPAMVLVTRERRTGSHRTEVHILSGRFAYQHFSLHAATALPQRIGQSREFLFQANKHGGLELIIKREPPRLSLRVLPLP